ncbi:MAG: GGDEF domain-containing protein [Gemmatimonadota bacterium]
MNHVLNETEGLPGLHGVVPPGALVLSLLALAVAGLASFVWPESLAGASSLIWLLALIPSFLLAYHRGWSGAALGLAGSMALLIGLDVVPRLARGTSVDWYITGAITVTLISVSLGAGAISESLHRERRSALEMAYADPLTRLPNRRVMEMFLARHFAGARRGRPLAVVMFDLDGFKGYNDRFGHQAGDEALRTVGAVLGANTRQADMTARYGGEEFLAVLPGETAEGAHVFAERVRAHMADRELPTGERLTVSAGVAEFGPAMANPDDLVEAADRALYRAKTAGRDRVEVETAPDPDAAVPGA